MFAFDSAPSKVKWRAVYATQVDYCGGLREWNCCDSPDPWKRCDHYTAAGSSRVLVRISKTESWRSEGSSGCVPRKRCQIFLRKPRSTVRSSTNIVGFPKLMFRELKTFFPELKSRKIHFFHNKPHFQPESLRLWAPNFKPQNFELKKNSKNGI